MEKLRRVYRAAAQLIGGFKKFDHISQYMRDELHWLPFPQRISYRIASLVWRCLSGWASSTLRELCCPLSSCTLRTLRSSVHGNLAPALRQCRPILCLLLVQQPGMDSNRSKAPPKRFLFSIPPPSQDMLFSAWPRSGAPLGMDLEGTLYKF